jgi:hypothetical protein
MKRFEYKAFTFAYAEKGSIAESDIKELNKLGAQGWEMAGVVPIKTLKMIGSGWGENVVAMMKREVEK